MEFITDPRVHVVAKTRFLGDKQFLIPDDGTDAEKLGSFAAKGCYDSDGTESRGNIANQQRCLAQRHGSVIEHASASLRITGISRGLSHELVRHRHFSVSQRSTRYVDYGEVACVLEPYMASLYHRMRGRDGNELSLPEDLMLSEFMDNCETAVEQYKRQYDMLESLNPHNLAGTTLRKWARGIARQQLPHWAETRLTLTGNHRSWRRFIELRSDRHAEAEIRRLAEHVYKALVGLAPVYYEPHEITDVQGIAEFRFLHANV